MRIKRRALAGLVPVLALLACSPGSSDGDAPRGAATAGSPRLRSDLVVTTSWLADRLGEDGLVVVHVGDDRAEYEAGHIPGARFLPVSALLVERDGIPNELPPVETLDSLFEAVGVSDDVRVILYGQPLYAARAFVALDHLGHGGMAALLDGGLSAWEAEGWAISPEPPEEPAGGTRTPAPPRDLVGDAGGIPSRRESPGVAIRDARPPAQYWGYEAGPGVPRPGHIPGAANLFWEETLKPGGPPVLEDTETLQALFQRAGVAPDDTVVTYCRTGLQASFLYFVARYLGYETRLYDGSFIDWSRRTGLPVSVEE